MIQKVAPSMQNAFQPDPIESLLGSLAGYQYLTSMGLPPSVAANATGVPGGAVDAFNLNGAGTLIGQNSGGNGFGSTGYGFGPSSSISGAVGAPQGVNLGGMFGLGASTTPASTASPAAPASTAAQTSPNAFGTPSTVSNAVDAFSDPSTISAETPTVTASENWGLSGITPNVEVTSPVPSQALSEALSELSGVAPSSTSAASSVSGYMGPAQVAQDMASTQSAQMSAAQQAAIAEAMNDPNANAAAMGVSNYGQYGINAQLAEQNTQPATIAELGQMTPEQQADATVFGLQAEMPSMQDVPGYMADTVSSAQAATGISPGVSGLGPATASNLGLGETSSPTIGFSVDMAGKAPFGGAEDDDTESAVGIGPSDGSTGVSNANQTESQALGAAAAAAGVNMGQPVSATPSLSQAEQADMFGFSTDAPAPTTPSPPGMSNLGMSPASTSDDFGSDDSPNAFGTAETGPSSIGLGLGATADAFGTTDGQTSEAPGDQGSIGSIGSSADAFGAESGAAGFGGFGGVSDAGFGGVGGHGGFGGASDVGVSDNGTDFGGIGDAGYGGYGGGDGYGGPGDGSAGDAGV